MRLLLATTALAVPMHGSALAHVVIAGGATETVNGAGGGTQASPWHIGGDLRLETATLDILNGGFVQSSAGKVGDTPGFDTPVGVVNITGALSRWQMLSGFSAGYNGSGTVIISGGGQMESTQGNLAILSGSLGTVTVTGADSTWKNFGYVVIGDAGTGTLEILDGGSVSNTDATLSAALGGRGSVRVAGEDSYWYSSGILRVARDYVGVLVVADGGTVEVDGSVIIADLGTSGGRIVIGDEYWNTPVAPGTLIASEVSFGAGSGGLVFNHTAEKYGFGADVSGDGTIGVYSGTTSLSGDSSDFVGIATVQSGTLLVNGLLGGTTAVNGTLGGAGVVANASIRASGTLAPGNSIGKLTVTTDLIFDDDSRYEVEVNDGGNTPGVNNDFTYVGGTLTIGNDVFVSVIPANGTDDGSTYTPGLVYTILTADGGIAGTFALAKTKMAFLTPELSYDANNVYLELTLNGGGDGDGDGGDGDGGGGGGGGGSSGHVGFGDVANTQNQKGVGNALENFGPGHPLYDEIIMMTEEEARAAYDALSGEAHASSSTSQFMTAGEIRQQLLDRLAAILGAGGGGLASLAHAPAAGDAAPGTASVWGQLFGSWGRTDGNAVAASIDRDAYGFIGGIDREIVPGVRAGIAAGYSRSTYDVAARSSSGDSDNFHLAGYAGTALGAFDVKGVVSYGYGKVRAERTVIVGGLTNNLSADYATHTFQAGLEAGYDLDLGSLVLTPFAGLAGVHVETEGFTETGGPAALTFGSTSTTTGVSTLGLRARRQAGSVGLTAAAAWRHAFGDVEPTSRAAFASAPAATFAVRGTPIAENALALDAAIDAKLGADTTLTFGYAGELASDARDHGLRAELRVEF